MWLVNFRNLLIGVSVLWNGSVIGAMRVNIPKEAQVFRDKIISDGLSYSYSALEFGASNETQFKTWSVVQNLSAPHNKSSTSVHEYGYEDSRWPIAGSKKQPQKPPQRLNLSNNNHRPSVNNHKKTTAPTPSLPFHRPSDKPAYVSPVYPQFGFHPLLFSTPVTPTRHSSPVGLHHYEFRSSTLAPFRPSPVADQPRVIVTTHGISVSSDNSKKSNFKQLGRLKKGKPRRKGKFRPSALGLDYFNTGIQQALHIIPSGIPVTPKQSLGTTTANPFPKLSPGYSRVTQNLPNALPAVVYGTNHLEEGDTEDNNSWIPIVGPHTTLRAGVNQNGKGKKLVNLSRNLKNKARPRHRYSSNYSNHRGTNQQQMLKVRSHRLAGILSQTRNVNQDGDVVAVVYPNNHNRNYSTVTARSRASASTTGDGSEKVMSTTTGPITTTITTAEDEIIHARITKIPNHRPVDVVLNVTTQFPVELDERVRARLKAIRKIVRLLPL